VQPHERSSFDVNAKYRAARRRGKPFVVETKSPLNESIVPPERTEKERSLSWTSTMLPTDHEGYLM
jgi:hypothetical protein